MRKILIVFSIAAVVWVCSYSTGNSWGFFAHQRINRMAVFTLPPEMIGFYKQNIEFITTHAVDPDKRRNAVKDEAERHYIDIDHYSHSGKSPFEIVPAKWKDAVVKFTEDTLKSYGIVPWHINLMMMRLTDAFKEEKLDRILHLSADLGHYVGDANVPLHTTENYNGQMTNQKGIHGFWESRLPELMHEEYDYFVGRAAYIDKPLERAWNIVKSSFAAKDSVLLFEAKLNETYPSDQKYTMENRGNTLMKVYSEGYSRMYDKMLDGMVEKRLRQSIISVGSFWYTAWVNAGKPDLSRLGGKQLTAEERKKIEEEEKEWKKEKIKNAKGHDD